MNTNLEEAKKQLRELVHQLGGTDYTFSTQNSDGIIVVTDGEAKKLISQIGIAIRNMAEHINMKPSEMAKFIYDRVLDAEVAAILVSKAMKTDNPKKQEKLMRRAATVLGMKTDRLEKAVDSFVEKLP